MSHPTRNNSQTKYTKRNDTTVILASEPHLARPLGPARSQTNNMLQLFIIELSFFGKKTDEDGGIKSMNFVECQRASVASLIPCISVHVSDDTKQGL
jgi:hypothetical protein